MAIFASNAPDFDFLPGLLVGDINRYHQGVSHSLFAAIAFGLAASLLSPWLNARKRVVTLAGSVLYATHLFLDYFRVDARAPFGQPLFWPITDAHWIAPHPIFQGISHGTPGDSFAVFLSEVFSPTNLIALGLEVLLIFPIFLIALYFSAIRSG